MPLNRLRAALAVYGRHVEVVLIIAALLLGGGVVGYMIRSVQMADVIAMVRADHAAEVERLQASHRESLAALSRRLDGLAENAERSIRGK